MAIVSKSGYKRNIQIMSSGGSGGSSYYGFAGPYYYPCTTNPGQTKIDIYYRTWKSDTQWKAFRSANGYLPTRQMTGRRFTGTCAPKTMDVIQYTYGPIYSRKPNACWYFGFDPAVLPANFVNSMSVGAVVGAQNQCLQKARDMKFSAPIFLAEGRKTVGMIAETARKLAEAYSAFRKGNFRRVAELLGTSPRGSSNNWLAYQYGWRPLLADLKGLAELAAQQLELGGRKPRFKVYGNAKGKGVSYTYVASNDGHTSPGCGGYTESTYTQTAPEHIGKAWLLLEVQYSDVALASQLGFGGFSDIASVAWELVPFSFVFDWFVDVGGYLANMSALKGLKVLDGGYSLEQNSTLKKWCSRPAYYSNFGFYNNGGPIFNGRWSYYQRQSWTGDLPSSFTTHLWDALNARRIISAAALGLQRV